MFINTITNSMYKQYLSIMGSTCTIDNVNYQCLITSVPNEVLQSMDIDYTKETKNIVIDVLMKQNDLITINGNEYSVKKPNQLTDTIYSYVCVSLDINFLGQVRK